MVPWSIVTGFMVVTLVAANFAGFNRSLSAGSNLVPASPKSCPWVAQSLQGSASPLALANEVVAKMTLDEKAAFVVLAAYGQLENRNSGVARLCIPAISLSDGPDGIANGLTGVTQFPAAIGLAASFNPTLAKSAGAAIAQEARAKGLDVVQGPNLNLVRVPQSGRIFETYGEDPYLTSALGVANIVGIQSQGVMANAKHIGAYTQETARERLNQVVPLRAMAELYNVPFRAVVQQGHVASMMCSYGSLNGVNTCSDPYVYSLLASWGFTGFVRSDLNAVSKIAPSFRAGISLMKPAPASALVRMVQSRALAPSALDRAVRSVLTEMFRFKIIGRSPTGSLSAVTTSPAHSAVALDVAQSSVVLLKNSDSLLPIGPDVTSIAVIGAPASESPLASGGGSSAVNASKVVTPLSALRSLLGSKVRVSYSAGGPSSLNLDQLNDVDVVGGTPLKLITPIKTAGEPGKSDIAIESVSNVTAALATAASPGTGDGWSRWKLSFRPKRTGYYEVAIQQIGDTWVYLNGQSIMSSSGLHARTDMSTTVPLIAGRKYELSARWFAVRKNAAPTFALLDVTADINAAVASARSAKMAIIFAGNYMTEGADQPNLALPGDANVLIAAVAKVNPHTVVVLNTGGAVVMPWLAHVQGLLEAWYPGQEDGTAIADILTGAVDPSGRLPITFPVNAKNVSVTGSSQFPGVNSTVNFGTGLDIGYRWYQAHGVAPLFAFGFGLNYTKFELAQPTLTRGSAGVTLNVRVTNTGERTGTEVVQAYVRYPNASGEPPEQLRSFTRVALAPGQSKLVALQIPNAGFQIFQNNRYVTLSGRYGIDIGESSSSLALHRSVQMP
jgi:beta-glucosidase